MSRLAPLLLAVAAVVVLAVVLFGGSSDEESYLPPDDPLDAREEANPELLTSEAARRKKAAEEAEAREAARRERERPPAGRGVLFLAGRVVAADGGAGIAGALLSAEHESPAPADPAIPRLPRDLQVALDIQEGTDCKLASAPRPGRTVADDEGAFRWMVDPAGNTNPSICDVFARAPGYVPSLLRRPPAGQEALFRLQRAIPLDVRVVDRVGRPVAGAVVVVRPDARAKGVLGHAGVAASNEQGRARVDGLAPGPILVTVDHPEFMPVTAPAFDPALEPVKEIRLPPALRVSFRLRSDDASLLQGPLLSWETEGAAPQKGLQLLRIAEGVDGGVQNEIVTEPVRIPCAHRNVRLEVKANGFQPWVQVEPVPAEGGEREVLVVLTRDTGLASLELAFEDPDGEPVSYRTLGSGLPTITPLDGATASGGIRTEMGETLVFQSIPPGRYRITKASPAWAPAEVDVDVRPGEPTKATVKLRPPAKLRIRFTSSEQHMVRFRLLRGDVILQAFPEDPSVSAGGKDLGDMPQMASGADGAVFSGLASGPCTVEVTSPELQPARRTVRLEEGETAEVEIEVEAR